MPILFTKPQVLCNHLKLKLILNEKKKFCKSSLKTLPYQHDELMLGQWYPCHSRYQRARYQDPDQPNPQQENRASLPQGCSPMTFELLKIFYVFKKSRHLDFRNKEKNLEKSCCRYTKLKIANIIMNPCFHNIFHIVLSSFTLFIWNR